MTEEFIAVLVTVAVSGDPPEPEIIGATWPVPSVTRLGVGAFAVLLPSRPLAVYAWGAPRTTVHEADAPEGCTAAIVRCWDDTGGQPVDPVMLGIGGTAPSREQVGRLATSDEIDAATAHRRGLESAVSGAHR